MQIITNKDELIKSGNKIIGLAEEYNQKIIEIENLTQNMQLYWSGRDAEAFENMINEKCVPALKQICNMLENFGKYMKQVPIIYETFEKNTIESSKKDDFDAK